MNQKELFDLLNQLKNGNLDLDQAVQKIQSGAFTKTDLGFADLDNHRLLRHGLGEVVYGEGKTIEQILSISEHLSATGKPILLTRLDGEKTQALLRKFPDGRANTAARTFILNPPTFSEEIENKTFVAILAAGTSDLPVAEEACEVCIAMETPFVKFFDVGVAGLHRLLDKAETIQKATALVVVAGMEGALPSVVAGLFGKPIFAVPTSVGYGVSFGGVTALLAMLNSCAPGVSVVNIDNGFSAGFAACQVVRAVRNNLTDK